MFGRNFRSSQGQGRGRFGRGRGGPYGLRKPNYRKSYAVPRPLQSVPGTLVSCHNYHEVAESAGKIAYTAAVDGLLLSPTFIKWSRLTERFCVKSISIKVVSGGENSAMFTFVSKDEAGVELSQDVFMRQPSLMMHTLGDSRPTSRFMSTRDMGQIAQDKVLTGNAAILTTSGGYAGGIKLLIPNAKTDSKIGVYVTIKVMFEGSKELTEAALAALGN